MNQIRPSDFSSSPATPLMSRRRASGLLGSIVGSSFAPIVSCASPRTDDASELLSVDYQARDFEIVDYQFYRVARIPQIAFRGPPISADTRNFVTCIGAAQTLGVFVEKPFPQIVSEALGIPAWNAGVGGAGPSFFAQQPRLLERANRSRVAVVQIMAARSESNSRFRARAASELLFDTRRGDVVNSVTAWSRVGSEEPELYGQYVQESQESWKANMRAMLDALSVPVVLFWFSPTPYAPAPQLALANAPNPYPQFVDSSVVSEIVPRAEAFVACHSARNQGYPLTSRLTGANVEVDYSRLPRREGVDLAPGVRETHNTYYPSPQMHEDAATALLPTLRTILAAS